MSDFDDAIGDMTEDLLTEAGSSFVYIRGNTTTTMTLRKSQQRSTLVETASGLISEEGPVDFIGLTTAFPYDPPERGDRIAGSGLIYEVQPTTGEKCYRQISDQMMRVHTKRVK